MGVYIKGMEMPTSCRACLYSRTDIRNVDWCVLTEKDLPCDCPLVPVQSHGRLIDADALKAMWDDEISRMLEKGVEYLDYHVETLLSDCKREVDKMPTIIPASGGRVMNDTTFQGDSKVAYVPVVVNAKLSKPSRADRIRSMTDEELAEFLKEQTSLAHNYGYECADGEPDFPDGIPANYDYLTWLQEEVKDG